MRKLIVTIPGLTIKLPGIAPVQTPAEINIDKVDLNLVVSYLRQYGLTKYKITEEPGSGNIKITKPKVEEDKKQGENTDLSLLKDEFASIKHLLQKLVDKEPSVVNIIKDGLETTDGKSKKFGEDDTDSFIPAIETDGLELKGETVTSKESEDVSDNVEALKKLSGK